MKNVERLIEKAGFKVDGSTPYFHIKVDGRETYMDLTIEGIGWSPDGRQLISVTHYAIQNGDLMRDPEIVFLVDPRLAGLATGFKDGWFPTETRQDFTGYHAVAIDWRGGQMLQNKIAMRDIKGLARVWNTNIKHQGFLKAKLEAKATN
jgi:hypothetical protein